MYPNPFLDRIEPGNPNDPLLLQVAPFRTGTSRSHWFTQRDPLNERKSVVAPRVLQKYPGRVFVCRCFPHAQFIVDIVFAGHFPYHEHRVAPVEPLLSVLRKDSSIFEVILSGGDPLILPNDQLEHLIAEISSVPHVRCIRIHTRFGVVLPQRITTGLLDVLAVERPKIVVVTHINHSKRNRQQRGVGQQSTQLCRSNHAEPKCAPQGSQ